MFWVQPITHFQAQSAQRQNKIPAREETPNGREAGAKAEAAATQATRTLRRSMAILVDKGIPTAYYMFTFFGFLKSKPRDRRRCDSETGPLPRAQRRQALG
jgi:hypothetical protein